MTYAHLPLLFGGYFHQDWRLEASSVTQAVQNFVSHEPSHNVREARAELRHLMASDLTDVELHDLIVDEWGSCFDPMLIGVEMRAWLAEIDAALIA